MKGRDVSRRSYNDHDFQRLFVDISGTSQSDSKVVVFARQCTAEVYRTIVNSKTSYNTSSSVALVGFYVLLLDMTGLARFFSYYFLCNLSSKGNHA